VLITRIKRHFSTTQHYIVSVFLILCVSIICFLASDLLDYKVVALLLLMSVSLLAMLFDIFPVLLAATLSALIWDFFFIPPRFTFNINATDDILLFAMYFIIAMLNAVLTFKIRQMESKIAIKEEKERTLKLYDSLLNSLSHELRTPIATIIGATDLLNENTDKLTETNKKELVTEISLAGLRLNEQVENLLNMSRLQAGMLQTKQNYCEMNELIYKVLQKFEQKHEIIVAENLDLLSFKNLISIENLENQHKHIINIAILPNFPLIKLDDGLLEQVLYNLLNNALQYTPKGSFIDILLSLVNNNDSNNNFATFKIIVKDNGNGFPKNEINKVFDKFYRLQNTKTGGTGLGLSIVKGFVEAMQGEISLQNVVKDDVICGAEFTILLPIEVYK
jgi:two-component system sensor histidine kinase KdpD